MSWHWQDDACWQSCSAEARARADGWLNDTHALRRRVEALADLQPLVALDDAQLTQIRAQADALAKCSYQLIVIGTGGASLGAQALCALAADTTRVRFFENCDPATAEIYRRTPRDETAWCIISKSGETVETLAATLSLIAHYETQPALLRERVRVITENRQSTLGQLATALGWEIIDHRAGLGGRFSVFSAVGLLPACYAGLDIYALADAARQGFIADSGVLQHAAWLAATMREKSMHVLMAYADRLRPTTQWHKQLWAESLGKDGLGTTPVTAIGAIDQHSQLQLYLDGPRDKVMTVWLPQVEAKGPRLPQVDVVGLGYLAGHCIGDVMNATGEATVQTLTEAGVPLRVVRGALTPQTLAAWMARQMLETIAVAALIGVDPYSQPAVEAGKTLTRSALRRTA